MKITMGLKIYAVILFPMGLFTFIAASGICGRGGLLARYKNFVPFFFWGLGLTTMVTSLDLYRSKRWAVCSVLIIGIIGLLILSTPGLFEIFFWGGLIVLSVSCLIKNEKNT